ncbi:type VI secretion system baseplate subunit TssE [Moritella sp. 5]|uniref:type VI secretion system baseplate subunit TssE n=1 Tax=Moritella sp. 5 TaxID=2746231 RepID=UPI001BA957A8|nr:type VI secretion system baseplate subunit TssE [Moritella sp. 5]QUM80161.1 type VI secretion system baseplate subunit TssE [Moritella sp. 5]
MEKGYRLFERIELGESKNSYEKVISQRHLIESIHQHLADLLNTHAGNAMTCIDYGLPDFNDVLSNHTNLVSNIRKNIIYTIKKFEPRIKFVDVLYRESNEDPLQLNFSISGDISHNGINMPLSIDVHMGVNGQFNV